MTKTGRNDPCPCGSGKKYKHCCLNKDLAPASPQDLQWRRIRREREGLPTRMLRFVHGTYGADALEEAWQEFMLWDDDAWFDPGGPYVSVFVPWFLHCWAPDPGDTAVADESLDDVPPTRAFLDRAGRHLTPLVAGYLESCLENPYSFFEVEGVQAGRTLTLRNLLTGESHEVYEAAASQTLKPHDVLFAQLATAGDITLLEGLCEITLPLDDMVPIIELRKRLRANEPDANPDGVYVDAAQLHEWDFEIRELFLDLLDAILNPVAPMLVTKDGDAIEFHRLTYDIESPQQVFEALQPFAIEIDAADPETNDIQRDAAGAIQRARLDLIAPGEDRSAPPVSLLGSAQVDGRRLTIEVNSRERAEWVKHTLVPAVFGKPVAPRADRIQTVGQALAERALQAQPAPELDDPAMHEMLAEVLRKHYATWPDTPLPALDGRTPREASGTPDGREQVTALVRGAEQLDPGGLPAAMRKPIFDAVRADLGLPADEPS